MSPRRAAGRPDASVSPAVIRARAAVLRHAGLTWAQIGAVLQAEYQLTALQAIRLAHGWSQPEAADAWCRRWPEQPKTLKAFSYWELWPAPAGRQPKLTVLIRLAELYQCRVADLVAGLPDFTHLDPAHRPPPPSRLSHLLPVTDRESRPLPAGAPALTLETPMRLTLIGMTALSGDTNCPALYLTDRGTYVVQGWRVTDPQALAQLDIPDHETVVEVPVDVVRAVRQTAVGRPERLHSGIT